MRHVLEAGSVFVNYEKLSERTPTIKVLSNRKSPTFPQWRALIQD